MIKERFEFVLTVAYLLCLVLLGLCIEESYYILAEHLFNSTAKTATCESQCLQGLAKSWSPGCVNVAGKIRQQHNSNNKVHQTLDRFLAEPCTYSSSP